MADDPDFAVLYEANYERLLVQLFAVTANLADAEDVVQEAFARACVRWRRLHAYDTPPAWVRRVAFHLALRGLWHTRRTHGLGGRPDPSREPPRLTADQLGLVEALGRWLCWHLFAFAYYVTGEPVSGRPEPATRRRGHVGSTVTELRAAYGRQLQSFPIEAPASIGFQVGPPGGLAIDGVLSSTATDGLVTEFHGGRGCGV